MDTLTTTSGGSEISSLKDDLPSLRSAAAFGVCDGPRGSCAADGGGLWPLPLTAPVRGGVTSPPSPGPAG